MSSECVPLSMRTPPPLIAGSELAVEFRLLGARDAAASVASDTLVYPAAGPEGSDLALRVGPRGVEDFVRMNPMYSGSSVNFADFDTSDMTWDYLDKIREVTSIKIVVKGIVTREDAASAVDAGADAIYVSNHGGRAEASGWGAIESLPEVVAAVDRRVPVMVDSGFRRGTDIFKALALGANSVCIGRAYIWALAAFGQPGVERVLEMLNAELSMVMGQMGSRSIAERSPQHIGIRR